MKVICMILLFFGLFCSHINALISQISFGRWHLRLNQYEDASVEPSDSLWKDKVEYVDVGAMPIEDYSNDVRELPLFMLGAAFYPSGRTFLNVFEMKYRTMMFDIAQKDDMLGYIHSDGSGRLASIGTICKVVDRQLMEDGRQIIALEGVERFRVSCIKKTLPYLVADVVHPYEDTPPANSEEEAKVAKLAMDVWQYLKFYLRMMRSYEPNKDMAVSLSTKQNRPGQPSLSATDAHAMRSAFSFSVANMIQMTQARESQLLLQTDDLVKRLGAEKAILTSASQLIAEQLIQMGVLTEAQRDDMKTRSFDVMDMDDDVFPIETMASSGVDDEDDEWDISRIE